MNEQERSELERIKQQHARLEQELARLATKLKLLESQLRSPQQTAAPVPPPIPPVIPRTSPPPPARAEQLVSQLSQKSAEPPKPAPAEPGFIKCLCQHCGGHLEFAAGLVGDTVACPHCGRTTYLVMEARPPAGADLSAIGPEPAKERSIEMRLGRHWAPRIGIVTLLTAFVFFANWTYQNFIIHLGPGGKLSLLYLASAMLLGAGAWWQRKAVSASLRNYAQVLFAGGLAAVYFTTYAAYHLEAVRVIDSAVLDGALLLAWAGFMVWIADRKKSEVLALFAVGLAYYSSVITHVGSFTLYSNLVLTLAAVFFLLRNRWAGLTFASLVATYAAYAYWRFFDGTEWHWASPTQGLWHGAGFLIAYWIVFTTAVFLSKHETFSGPNRATFLTLNNAAFFVTFLLTMLQVREGQFWKFSLSYGAALLVLAELARRFLAPEPLTKNLYLTQGLLLVTIGIIAKFTGLKLALLLGAESVVLLTLGLARKNFILQAGAYLSGGLSVGWGMDALERNDRDGLLVNAALGAMMAFNAWWSHRATRRSKAPVRPEATFFALLALFSWLATTWYNTSTENFPLALALEALALTLSVHLLGVREFALLGQGYLAMAQGAWLVHFAGPGVIPPWWNPALLLAITLGLSHWWQRQKILADSSQLSFAWQCLYGLAIVGVLYFWLKPLSTPADWLTLTSLLAVAMTAYGVLMRLWPLAIFGQIFLVISAGEFVLQLAHEKPAWHFPLAPIATLGALSFATVRWFQHSPDVKQPVREPLLQLALIYRWVALAMSLGWVWEYVGARERIWVLASLGLLVFLWAGRRRNPEALLFSAAFTLFGLGLFWFPLFEAPTVYWPNVLAILALLVEQQIARRLADRYPLDQRAHGGMIAVGGISLWLMVYRWLGEDATGFYLTAGWSALALALFACGMLLRERAYRWLGLGVLATALGRVFIFDVWKLKELYRILSFVALSLVLLVLGFIYNKYQEKIKEWL